MYKNDDHPYDNLANFGYKPKMKYNPLINLLYLWLHIKSLKIANSLLFLPPPPHI